MKKHLFKFALTLFVCMLSNVALADENYLVNEDFSTFPSGYSHSYSTPNSYMGWLLDHCKKEAIVANSKYDVLKIEDNNSGYAKTPSLDYAGDIRLFFTYARSIRNKTTALRIEILNGGIFKDTNSKDLTIQEIKHSSEGFTSGYYDIEGTNKSTTIKFWTTNGENYFLDDVKVIKLGEITLNDQINSSEAIAANNETSCTVKTVRTLKANIWNTLCLPFDVNMSILEAALGTGKNIELRTYSNYDAENKVMNFEVADNSTIEAGTPFLIKLNTLNTENTENTENTYEFTGVTIKNVAAKTIESNGVSFVGTYSPVELNTDGTNLFITTVNELAKPTATGNKMPGLRAYITVPSDFDFNDARLFLDDEATAINSIGNKKATNNATLYNLQGQRVKRPRSGLYIQNNKLTIIR